MLNFWKAFLKLMPSCYYEIVARKMKFHVVAITTSAKRRNDYRARPIQTIRTVGKRPGYVCIPLNRVNPTLCFLLLRCIRLCHSAGHTIRSMRNCRSSARLIDANWGFSRRAERSRCSGCIDPRRGLLFYAPVLTTFCSNLSAEDIKCGR